MEEEEEEEEEVLYTVLHKEAGTMSNFIMRPTDADGMMTTTRYHFVIKCIDRPDREVVISRDVRFTIKEREPRPMAHRRLMMQITESDVFIDYVINSGRVIIDPVLQYIKVRELSLEHGIITLAVKDKNLQ